MVSLLSKLRKNKEFETTFVFLETKFLLQDFLYENCNESAQRQEFLKKRFQKEKNVSETLS